MRDSTPKNRLAAAFELFDAAEHIMRQNLRRRFPHESDDAIKRRLQKWLIKQTETAPAGWTVRRNRGS
jgi:hypothetical protein